MKMKLHFCESKIGYWANPYTETQREKDRIKEQELIDLKPEVRRRGYLTKDELYELALRGYNLSRLRDDDATGKCSSIVN